MYMHVSQIQKEICETGAWNPAPSGLVSAHTRAEADQDGVRILAAGAMGQRVLDTSKFSLNLHSVYMHLLDMKASSTPTLPCMCANIRRAARAITQRYDEALRPLGLTITQFTILQALSLAGEPTQGELGEILATDSTTLTRTLAIMHRHGWIAKKYGADRRERRLRLTRAGENEFNRAAPYWRSTQEALRARFGKQRWDNLTKLINDASSLIAEQ